MVGRRGREVSAPKVAQGGCESGGSQGRVEGLGSSYRWRLAHRVGARSTLPSPSDDRSSSLKRDFGPVLCLLGAFGYSEGMQRRSASADGCGANCEVLPASLLSRANGLDCTLIIGRGPSLASSLRRDLYPVFGYIEGSFTGDCSAGA